MSETRARRVAEQIKKEVGQIISMEMKDPRLAALTSVTEVQVSRDLRYATIYISVWHRTTKENHADHKPGVVLFAARLGGGSAAHPEITIARDQSMDYGSRIDRVLKTLQMKEWGVMKLQRVVELIEQEPACNLVSTSYRTETASGLYCAREALQKLGKKVALFLRGHCRKSYPF